MDAYALLGRQALEIARLNEERAKLLDALQRLAGGEERIAEFILAPDDSQWSITLESVPKPVDVVEGQEANGRLVTRG